MIRIFRKSVLLLTFAIFTFGFIAKFKAVHSADFDTSINISYTVDKSGIMHYREQRKIINNSDKYYIPANSTEQFMIPTFKVRAENTKEDFEKVKDTIELYNYNGESLDYTVKVVDESIVIRTEFGRDVTFGEEVIFNLEYDNYELVEKNGNVWNIYVPGLSGEYDDVVTSSSGATNQAEYQVTLSLDKELDKPNFVLPSEVGLKEEGDFYTYTFSPENLVEQSAWIQIGNVQYYRFEIVQEILPSKDFSSKMFNVYYDLILPGESDLLNQKVYFELFDPIPKYVRRNEEGNVFARFVFSNNQKTQIKVNGYIVTTFGERVNKDNAGKISDIDLDKGYAEIEGKVYTFYDLLAGSKYWEVDAAEIQEKASMLKGQKESIYDIILEDYMFVTDNVDYDNLKTGVENTRNGALETLKGGSSVCMEYSDLLITLLRAQGIPARAAFGYGFDPKAGEETDEGHQWVEVYMPRIGWVPIDPTWGDTGRRNYIGADLDHALWRVASINVDTPSPITKYSIDDSVLEAPSFQINIVDSIPESEAMSLGDVLSTYSYTPKHLLLEKAEQLNVYGKLVFIGLPLILLFALVLIISGTVRNFFRRFSNGKTIDTPSSHDMTNNPNYRK